MDSSDIQHSELSMEKNFGQTLLQSKILRSLSLMTVLSLMKLCPWEKVWDSMWKVDAHELLKATKFN